MSSDPLEVPEQYPERERDLGFGSVVARESRKRLLNRDGTFNVRRAGLEFWGSLSLYHSLLNISWTAFFALVAAGYLAINAAFATLFYIAGPDALVGIPAGVRGRWFQDFFFSVDTFATIGYGSIAPASDVANWLVTVESLFGLLGFALATGILFARFSRPYARVVFSHNAVIAPYQGRTALMMRIANQRSSELIELDAKIVMSMFAEAEGHATRRFSVLTLERTRVAFFPLSWTIVHPIDESSPLHGLTETDLRQHGAEFLVLLTGIDETFSQTVHARSSYRYDEVVWGARFTDIFERDAEANDLTVNVSRIHGWERVPLPVE